MRIIIGRNILIAYGRGEVSAYRAAKMLMEHGLMVGTTYDPYIMAAFIIHNWPRVVGTNDNTITP